MMMTRRMVARALGATLLATLLAVPALAQEEEQELVGPFPIEGVPWTLSSLATDSGLTDVPADVEATLFLSGGEVVGSAGCNSYFGSYLLGPETLTFGTLGMTQALCEGPAQELEDAYMPLLEAVAGWSLVDGVLSLSNADGETTLVYGEPPVDVTATDVATLTAVLKDLQAQLDVAESEIASLAEQAEALNIDKLRGRVKANEEAIAEIDKTITKLRDRIKANEEAIAGIDTTINKLRNRIRTLEDTAADHEERIAALEAAPEQLPS